MYKENITVEELAEHELSWFKGEIVLIDNLKIFYEVFPRLLGSELLGFDTETRPTFKKGRKMRFHLFSFQQKTWHVYSGSIK